MATKRFNAMAGGIKTALATKGPQASRIRELAVRAGKLIAAKDAVTVGPVLDELEPLVAEISAPIVTDTGKESWEAKTGLRNEVAGKLAALEEWSVVEAGSLRERFNRLLTQASDETNEYALAVAGLDPLRTDVGKLHAAESGKRKQAEQETRDRDARELEDKGSGIPELFAKDEYEKLAAVQKPRVEEAERRCKPVPDLADVLRPVSEGWAKVEEAAKAENYLGANDLLGPLVGKIDHALDAAGKAEQRELELKQKTVELEKRTAKAPTPPSSVESGKHWKAATDKLGEVNVHLVAREVKLAGEDFELLGPLVATAESKQKEFDDEKDKAVKAREALPSYAAATTIAKSPPPDNVLDGLIQAFREKEKVVTDAEAAGAWPVAQNGRTVLQFAAKKLVDTHGLWDAYAKAYTATIKKNVEDAVVIVGNSPAPLKTEIDAFGLAYTPWDVAVGNGEWQLAKDAVAELARTAKALVDTHALWDAYTQLATPQFTQDQSDAIDVYNQKSPDLSAARNTFLSKYNPWNTAVKAKHWKPAADALPAYHQASKDLLAANARLETDFYAAYKGQVRKDIEEADSVRKLNVEVLTPATRKFAPVYEAWAKDFGAYRWVAATNGVATLHAAATTYNTAVAQYIQARDAFKLELGKVADYGAAVGICWGNPKPKTDTSPAEVREFRRADLLMEEAEKNGDFQKANRHLAEVKSAIAPLVPAFNDWKPYGLRTDALAPVIEKARAAAATAPAKLATEKANFETEANKIGPAASGKKWTDALNALNAAEPAARTLLAAVAQFEKERKPFVDAAGPARAAHAKAAAVIRALPSGKQTDEKVLAVTTAESEMAAAERDQKWTAGVSAANKLKLKSEELVAASATLSAAFSEEEAKVVPGKLATLEPRTEKASDPPVSDHVDRLQKAVVDQLKVVNDKVTAKDHIGAALEVEALVAKLEKMEEARAAHAKFREAFFLASSGPVQQARELGNDPKAVADVRNAALDKRLKRIEALAKTGQISQASVMIETWIEEAKGWKDKWAEAKEAHAALTTPPPDEGKLKALADAPGGGKVFDDLVASLPDDTSAEVVSKAMQVRYGVEITQFQRKADKFYDLEGVPPSAPDKSVKKLYKLLAAVPDTHVKGALTDIVRYTKDSSGGDYSAVLKKMNLYCGRSDDGKKEPLVKPSELPEVDEDCRPVDNENPKQFGFTALHEVGHAIDDAAGFMGSRRGDAKFGGWMTSSPDDAAEAAAAKYGYPKEYILKVLDNKGVPPAATERPLAPSTTTSTVWDKARQDAEAWCAKVVEGYGLWWRGAEAEASAIDGRVYQQAYATQWFSYPAAARRQGITGYQFRSPAEWFAELYAAYYTRKLKESHPAIAWLKDLKNPKA